MMPAIALAKTGRWMKKLTILISAEKPNGKTQMHDGRTMAESTAGTWQER
jgi:hypothetical protein